VLAWRSMPRVPSNMPRPAIAASQSDAGRHDSTIAGTGAGTGAAQARYGDTFPALNAVLAGPVGLAVDSAGNRISPTSALAYASDAGRNHLDRRAAKEAWPWQSTSR